MKRPLSRRITIAFMLFILLFSAVSSFVTYRMYTHSMLARYRKQMTSILDFVEPKIDHDDMAECARTYVESEKYQETQALLDYFVDHYEDLHYIYIMQVLDADQPVQIREICTGNSSYEKEFEPDMVLHLGDGEEDWYDNETAQMFRDVLHGDEDVLVINPSEWGVDYTLSRPLKTSEGEHYALLCVDVSIDEIQQTVYRNIYINLAMILIPANLFMLLFILWMRRNVIDPINRLQKSVADFASTSAGKRDPDELLFTPPEIHTQNEVQSLSEAVTKLSVDMRDYVRDMLAAEDETKDLQAHVTEMSEIAYQDALTRVKNKAAYDRQVQALNWDILNQTAQFAIVMTDLNDLKKINDLHGHDHGDAYIIACCRMICEVFVHSPVFRIGGDEFVAVLQGDDYRNRETLMSTLCTRFAATAQDVEKEPWERCSAAVGMSVYEKGDDVDAVFRRADHEMYLAKKKMKEGV